MKLLIYLFTKTDVLVRKFAIEKSSDQKKKLFNKLNYSLNNDFELNKRERVMVLRKLYEYNRNELRKEVQLASERFNELETINDEINQVL